MRIEPYWVLVSLSLRARADVFRSTSFKCIGFDEGNNCRLSYSVKTNLMSPAGDKIESRPFSRRRHTTRTTRIYFFFFLSYKLINPAEVKKKKAFFAQENNKLKHSGSCNTMSSSCNCPIQRVIRSTWRAVFRAVSRPRATGIGDETSRSAGQISTSCINRGASLPVRLFARTKLNKCQLKKLGRVDLLNVRTSGTFLAPTPKAYLALDPLS